MDGDLERTLHGDDYDMKVVIVMPRKNDRLVCGDDEIEVTQTFTLTGSSGSYRARVQWDRAWLYAGDDEATDDKVESGIVEWSTPSDTSVRLTLWECWHEYNLQWGTIVVSADGIGSTVITMTDCPSADCCPHEYECDDCCLYLTSPKILADNVGPYTEDEACSVANELQEGKFVFWDDDPTLARMKVTAEPAGGLKRTICPGDGGYGNAGSTLIINVSLVPSTLDPGVAYKNQVCIQYDPTVWEMATGPEGNAACDNPVCFAVTEELEQSFTLELKCKDLGPNPADIIDTITVTASDETIPTAGYDKHADFCVKLQFGYCGYTDPCCQDPVECEDCCIVYDYSSGFDSAENDAGTLSFTLTDCEQDPPVTLTVTMPEKLCTGDEFDVGLTLSGALSPEPEICWTWTGGVTLEGADPEPDTEDEDSVCWTPADTDMSASMKVKCVDGIDDQTFTVTFAGKTGIIQFRGCNDAANCCCDTYVPCCSSTCWFPSNGAIPTVDEVVPGLGRETGGPSQITDLIMVEADGTKIEQVSVSKHWYAVVDISTASCPEYNIPSSQCKWIVRVEITEVPLSRAADLGTQWDHEVWPPGTNVESHIPMDVAAEPFWKAGADLAIAEKLSGYGIEDCSGLIEFTNDDGTTFSFNATGGKSIPAGMRCDAWLEIEVGGIWVKAKKSDFPAGFFDGEEF